VQNVVALQPLFAEAKAQRNDDFCEGLTMVARALVQRNGNLMCSGQGSTLQLAQLTLEMVGHPNKGISELAMEFWDELEIVDTDKRHESLRAPIFQVLLEVLASRCAPYPPGFVDWDSCEDDGEEEFHMFRRRIEEALLSCCVVLRSDSLAVLCGMLSAAGDRWEAVEATLFSIGCIGVELMTQDEAAQRQQVLARCSLSSSSCFARRQQALAMSYFPDVCVCVCACVRVCTRARAHTHTHITYSMHAIAANQARKTNPPKRNGMHIMNPDVIVNAKMKTSCDCMWQLNPS
jgi:hypothetical protein